MCVCICVCVYKEIGDLTSSCFRTPTWSKWKATIHFWPTTRRPVPRGSPILFHKEQHSFEPRDAVIWSRPSMHTSAPGGWTVKRVQKTCMLKKPGWRQLKCQASLEPLITSNSHRQTEGTAYVHQVAYSAFLLRTVMREQDEKVSLQWMMVEQGFCWKPNQNGNKAT